MESTKLTLSVKSDSVPRMKEYAKRKHTSVSKLVQEYFDKIEEQEKKEDPLVEKYKNTEIPEWIQSLTGILKGKYPDDMDYKEMKYEYFKEKYDL